MEGMQSPLVIAAGEGEGRKGVSVLTVTPLEVGAGGGESWEKTDCWLTGAVGASVVRTAAEARFSDARR